MNTTTTGERLSLLLLHAVKQVSIKIFWWHRRTTESSVVCLLLCCAFLPQCAHLFHDLMCASARMLNGKSDKNKCAIRSFLYKFGKRCFSLWSYHFHHSMCHIIKSISPHVIGLLNFDLGFDYLLLSGSFSLRYDVFNGIFEGQLMSTVFVPQCFTHVALMTQIAGGKKYSDFMCSTRGNWIFHCVIWSAQVHGTRRQMRRLVSIPLVSEVRRPHLGRL